MDATHLIPDIFVTCEDARGELRDPMRVDPSYAACVRLNDGVLVSQLGLTGQHDHAMAIAFHHDDENSRSVITAWWDTGETRELHTADGTCVIRGNDPAVEEIDSLLFPPHDHEPPLQWHMIPLAEIKAWDEAGPHRVADLLPVGSTPPTEPADPRAPRSRRMRA